MHWDKNYPRDGGLMSYGSDYADMHRRAAAYVDRLLRGAKVSDLDGLNGLAGLLPLLSTLYGLASPLVVHALCTQKRWSRSARHASRW